MGCQLQGQQNKYWQKLYKTVGFHIADTSDCQISSCLVTVSLTDLVEVEDEVELAYVAEKVVQNLHKQVDAFQVHQLIVSQVNAEREEEACISSVDHFVRSELAQAEARERSAHSRGQEQAMGVIADVLAERWRRCTRNTCRMSLPRQSSSV